MTQQSIRDKIAQWRSKKKLTDVQAAVISRILNIMYPDDIQMDVDKYVYLRYKSENIEIRVSAGYIQFSEESSHYYKSWNLAEYGVYIPKVRKLILDRSQCPQVVAVRAVISQFEDWSHGWNETIWSADMFVGTSKITVVISPNSADVELCQPKQKSILARRGIAVTDTAAILDTILFYCKTTDKNYGATAADAPGASATSVFSSSSAIREQLEQDGLCREDVELAAATIEQARSRGSCIQVAEVIKILNGLAADVSNSQSSDFVDGWKEALSAAISRINARRL